jgi:GT2 family glycosyltransferase
MQLSVIIISYNTREMTLACLASVFKETRATEFEVIVVDNQSSDGSADAIAAAFPAVRLIRAENNIGFAAANNLACRQAAGDLILLLNPDTVVLDEAIDAIVRFAQAMPAAGIWGGRTLLGSRELDPSSCWHRMTPWTLVCRALSLDKLFPASPLFNLEGYGGWRRDSQREVDIVTGCFFLIRAELWRKLGGFDPAFFMYGEEADLCLRARALGCRPMMTPTATIVHYGGASEKVPADRFVRILKAKAQLVDRHWTGAWRVFGRMALRLWIFGRLAASSIRAWFGGGSRERLEEWRCIWSRRREWLATGSG